MRIVFDTNVLFAAFVSREGLCARIVEDVLASHELFFSPFILSELERTLEQKAGLGKPHVAVALESLIRGGTILNPAQIALNTVRDPNDVAILGTAVAARADVLISGDKDLLILNSFESIPILSPRQFYDRFLSNKS
jgi:putative PIN family toxin of toxin-antitoxin system